MKQTLKTQLLNIIKKEDGWVCGADLERREWRTQRGGLYKPSTVGSELRRITREMPNRVEKTYRKGTVFYKYIQSMYEVQDNIFRNK